MRVVFVTSRQMFANSKLVDYAKAEGYKIVVVPQALAAKLPSIVDTEGHPLKDLGVFYREWDRGFAFSFIEPEKLDPAERAVFEQTKAIIAFFGRKRPKVSKVLISETMRVDTSGYEIPGLWRPEDRAIIVKRDQLRSLRSYAGVLLHELTHAATGTDDRTLEFEEALTSLLGDIAEVTIRQ